MYYAPDGEDGFTQAPAGPLFLWGQSIFIIAQLLTSGLLHINELDTIRRYLPSYNRPRKGGRYSAFQVILNAMLRFVESHWSFSLDKVKAIAQLISDCFHFIFDESPRNDQSSSTNVTISPFYLLSNQTT